MSWIGDKINNWKAPQWVKVTTWMAAICLAFFLAIKFKVFG